MSNFSGGRGARLAEEVAKLRASVDEGAIDALTAAAAPIINPLALNRAKRRKKRVTPPKQIDMSLIWSAS